MLQILLAEDHVVVRNGIKMLLESEEGFNVIGEATNGKEVLDIVNQDNDIDLVLTDINMPLVDGIALTRELRIIRPDIQVVILSMLDSEKYIYQAFEEGASGYLLKNMSSEELIFALKHVNSGNRYLCSELSIKLVDRLLNSSTSPSLRVDNDIEFSSREMEVLTLIAEGLTNSEMSEKLFLSKRTIEGHRQSLIEKTGSRNTAVLIRYAILNGMIQ